MAEPGISQAKPIEALARPGSSWTYEERDAVWEWLLEPGRYRLLLRFALHLLGESAVPEDAEDAIGDFFLKQMPTVIEHFDPARSSSPAPFWTFILSCLRQYCSKFRTKGERRQTLFVVPGSNDDPAALDRVIDQLDLERQVERELAGEMRRALRVMPRHFAMVLALTYLGKGPAEIAQDLGLSVTNAKVRLTRARAMLRGLIIHHGGNRK
jgi:RNA polymerase sigma factor (sigma-70 family)